SNPFGANRGLQISFTSEPPDLALSSSGLQQRVTGLLGGQGAIESLFKGNLNSGLVTDVFGQGLLSGLFDKTGVAKALRLDELELEYNRYDAFTLRLSRQLFGPFYLGYWRRLSGGTNLAGNTEQAAWEFTLAYHIPYRLFNGNLQFSWTTNEQ